jgi:hypothetical protein
MYGPASSLEIRMQRTTKADLTTAEFGSLFTIANGVMSRTIPAAHRARLVELRLIQDMMGILFVTPEGRMVART